jgi:hypothetical protein
VVSAAGPFAEPAGTLTTFGARRSDGGFQAEPPAPVALCAAAAREELGVGAGWLDPTT